MESSKYDKLVKSLADLDVALVDANNEYRSTYDIMSDIAEKWNSLTSMEQAALAETVAGTRQQAVGFMPPCVVTHIENRAKSVKAS